MTLGAHTTEVDSNATSLFLHDAACSECYNPVCIFPTTSTPPSNDGLVLDNTLQTSHNQDRSVTTMIIGKKYTVYLCFYPPPLDSKLPCSFFLFSWRQCPPKTDAKFLRCAESRLTLKVLFWRQVLTFFHFFAVDEEKGICPNASFVCVLVFCIVTEIPTAPLARRRALFPQALRYAPGLPPRSSFRP